MVLVTFFSVVLYIVLPFTNFIQINLALSKIEGNQHLWDNSFFLFITSISVGITLTILRYFMLKNPKNKLKYKLIHHVLILALLISFLRISDLYVSIRGSSIGLDIKGLLLLTIFAWIPFLIIPTYELFISARKKSNRSNIQHKIFQRAYLKCPDCKYLCKKTWKKCPICESKLY